MIKSSVIFKKMTDVNLNKSRIVNRLQDFRCTLETPNQKFVCSFSVSMTVPLKLLKGMNIEFHRKIMKNRLHSGTKSKDPSQIRSVWSYKLGRYIVFCNLQDVQKQNVTLKLTERITVKDSLMSVILFINRYSLVYALMC